MTKTDLPKKAAAKKAAVAKPTAAKTASKAPKKATASKTAASKAAVKTPARNKASQTAAKSSEAFVEAQLKLITTALDDNKAEDMLVVDLRGRSALADYLVIASGRSGRQVGALGDYVVKALAENGQHLKRREGVPANDWVLLDTGDVIVHLFRPEVREYYQLEKMWSDDKKA